MATSKLKVKKRELLGKSGSRQTRNEGRIPAVLYGKGTDTIAIDVDPGELKKALATDAGRNTLLEIEIDTGKKGKSESKLSLLKDMQLNYVTRKPLHLDFQTVDMKKKVVVSVALEYVGRAQGVKEGGILEEIFREIEVECLPGDIPSRLEIDVTELVLGQGIHIKDIELPDGVTALSNPDDMAAMVIIPRGMDVEEEVEEEEVEGEEGELAEGEVEGEGEEGEPAEKEQSEGGGEG